MIAFQKLLISAEAELDFFKELEEISKGSITELDCVCRLLLSPQQVNDLEHAGDLLETNSGFGRMDSNVADSINAEGPNNLLEYIQFLRSKMDESEQARIQYEEKLSSSESNNHELKEKVTELQHYVLKQTFQHHTKSIAFMKYVQLMKKEIDEFKQQNGDLKTTVEDLTQQNSCFQEQNATLSSSIAELQHQDSCLQEQNATLTSSIAELQHQNSCLQEQNATLTSSIAELQHQNDSLREENIGLKRRIGELELNVGELELNVGDLHSHREMQDKQIQELMNRMFLMEQR